jgi:hypothetical protein
LRSSKIEERTLLHWEFYDASRYYYRSFDSTATPDRSSEKTGREGKVDRARHKKSFRETGKPRGFP